MIKRKKNTLIHNGQLSKISPVKLCSKNFDISNDVSLSWSQGKKDGEHGGVGGSNRRPT